MFAKYVLLISYLMFDTNENLIMTSKNSVTIQRYKTVGASSQCYWDGLIAIKVWAIAIKVWADKPKWKKLK